MDGPGREVIRPLTGSGAGGRSGPSLLIGGASILLYRTVALLSAGATKVLKRWVVGLTIAEMIVDVTTIAQSARAWCTRHPRHLRWALRAGAAATLLHAIRVAIFVLGRTGPWKDFDVRPEQRDDHGERWTWAQVVFAGVLSALGVVGVVLIWLARRSGRRARFSS